MPCKDAGFFINVPTDLRKGFSLLRMARVWINISYSQKCNIKFSTKTGVAIPLGGAC